MEPYFFTLRNGQCGYSDPIGVELTNHEAALDYARLIAAELMKNREQETRRWRIEVRNNEGTKIGVVDFATKEKMPVRDVPSVGTRSVERHG